VSLMFGGPDLPKCDILPLQVRMSERGSEKRGEEAAKVSFFRI
jgi:hypothetical protein